MRQGTGAVALLLCIVSSARDTAALDIDIFTGTRVDPNVLIVFDNSGSMGSQAYNTYPNTIYDGSFTPGTIYTRCRNTPGVVGGDVNANCTCRNTQTSWVVDQSGCAATFVDIIPPPAGDDTDDRESRRKLGNRRNFEVNAPKNCTQPPFQACSVAGDCTGTGNTCSAQNKLAVAKGVVTSLVNDPSNADLRLGLEIFNPTGLDYGSACYTCASWVTSWQVNNGVYQFPIQDMTAGNRATLTTAINNLSANGATPTSHRLVDAWRYFNGQATASGFTSSPVQYACQRNYVLMVTDGIPEVEADRLATPASACAFTRLQSFVGNPGDLNSDGKENPTSPSYLATTGEMYNCGSDYLDDTMLKIHGLFPLGNTENQPLNLYAVSFGFDYCQEPAAGDTSPGAGSLLWRAAKKYGGGECLAATEPDELDDALREAFNLIKNDAQSFVAPVVPVSQTNRTQSGEYIYVALFSPREGQQEWPGNVKRYQLDRANGTICNHGQSTCTTGGGSAATTGDGTLLPTALSAWDADTGGASGSAVTSGGVGAKLKAMNLAARHIYTYAGSGTGNLGNLPLTGSAQAFAKSNTSITPEMLGLTGADATAAKRDQLIDYIYGFDAYDSNNNGNTTEKRTWILGDIIHSVPLIVNYESAAPLIIVGSNDGMLHAFDDGNGAQGGEEVWAFVPPDVLGNLNKLRPGQSSQHPFFVDASPKMKQLADGRKILVFGLGRGGRAYYALDITSRSSPTLLWRINEQTSGFAELGMSFSTPALTRFANVGSPIDVAVFGGGYDPHFDDPVVSSPNSSGYGRTVYMVNLLTGARLGLAAHAQMTFAIPSDPLMFDVNGDGVFDRGYVGDLGGNMWRISHDFTVTRLFHTGGGRRIFYPPDAVLNGGSVSVYFGTGDRSNPTEDVVENRFYAVQDDGTNDLSDGQLLDVTDAVVQPGSEEADDLAEDVREAHGWYLRLAGDGEKVLAPPTVYFNVAFATFTPSDEVCEAGGAARLYLVDPYLGSPTVDLAGTTGAGLGGGEAGGGGIGSGPGGALAAGDRAVVVGKSIPTSLKVTFGDDTAKAFFGVTKGGGVGLQPLNLPQIASNVVPISWRQVW